MYYVYSLHAWSGSLLSFSWGYSCDIKTSLMPAAHTPSENVKNLIVEPPEGEGLFILHGWHHPASRQAMLTKERTHWLHYLLIMDISFLNRRLSTFVKKGVMVTIHTQKKKLQTYWNVAWKSNPEKIKFPASPGREIRKLTPYSRTWLLVR